jgi:hypothetical protein
MSTTTTTTTRAPMSTTRKLALGAGLFYIATFVFSIPTLGMTDTFVHNANFVHGAGSGSGVQWAALFDMLTGLTGIGTAVMVYPVIKRYGRTNAIAFVASRTLEAAILAVSAISLLSVYTLRQDLGATNTVGLDATAAALVAVHKWTFLFGPGVMATVNALCFATVLRRTGLVPRVIPTVGLIGAPLLAFSSIVTIFGGWDQTSSIAMLFTLPIAAWELAVGIYMTFKGFKAVTVEITDNHDHVNRSVDHVYA